MASLARTLSLRLCGALIAGGLALPQQAPAATQCVNQNAPAPLEICVGDDATPGVWVSQPNGRQYQYYGGNSWGTAIRLDGANAGLQFSTQYFPLNSVTPVSNVTTGSGTPADPYIITTVVALGGTDVQLTQRFRYVNGDRYFTKAWTVENLGATSYSDVRFFHGGDTYFGGDDNARSWYDADLRMVYVNNSEFSNSGYMAFYANPLTPLSHYFSGSYWEGYDQVTSGALNDSFDSSFLDAGYYLQWNRPDLRAGETWRIEAFETWSPPGSLQVLTPGDEYVAPGATVTKTFKIHNLSDTSPLSVTLAASTSSGWTLSLPGGPGATLAPLQVVEVPVVVEVPAGAAAGDSASIVLDVTDGALNTTSGTTRLRIPSTDYAFSTRELDFGTVAAHSQTDLVVTFTNGSDPVSIGAIGASDPLPAPFSIVADTCSNATVAALASCTVTVRFAPATAAEYTDSFGIPIAGEALVNETISVVGSSVDQLIVSSTASTGGSIAPGSIAVGHGETTTFTLSAQVGYRIAAVTGCSGALAGDTFTTGPVTGDCVVQATFERILIAVGASPGVGGSITPSSQNVFYGDAASFVITPASGFAIGSVSGCAGTLSGNTFTTQPLTAACTLSAGFMLTVTATSNGGGSITPPGFTGTSGDTATFTVAAQIGYRVVAVDGCGGALVGNTYTTGALSSTCAVAATFERIPFTLGASAGTGGNVTLSNPDVQYGDTASFVITPANGYVVSDISGCTGTLSGNTFTTQPLSSTCILTVTFVEQMSEVVVSGKGQGGGGSFELLSLAGLLLLALRRIRRAIALAVAGVAITGGAQAGDPGFHVGASLGTATSSENGGEMTRVLQAQGYAVTASLDDRRSAWRLHGGWSVNRFLAAEVGYSDLGEVSSRYAGSLPVLAVDDFLAAAASIHPRTADGFDLSLAGRHALPIDAKLALHARAGLFRWDAKRSIRASDGRVVSMHDRGTDLLIGAGLGYAMTSKVDLTAEWMHYELDDESVQAVSLGLRYRW